MLPALLLQLLDQGDQSLVFGIDETVERRGGPKSGLGTFTVMPRAPAVATWSRSTACAGLALRKIYLIQRDQGDLYQLEPCQTRAQAWNPAELRKIRWRIFLGPGPEAAFHSRNQPLRNLMNMAAYTKPCLLCGNSATGNNRSSEHIVPAALGGTLTVSGFICQQCNSDAGRSCDAALAQSFEGLTRLLDIPRQKSLPRARVTYTSDGTPIRVLPGNRVVFGHTTEQEITEGNRKILRITAASKDELRKSVQKIKDRRNLDLDVETFVEDATVSSTYIDEPYLLLDVNWGPDHYKSLVKSALALVCCAGLDPSDAEIAMAYLTGDTEEKCFFPYYNKDLVTQREAGMPINCVYVKGDPVSRELMAYVEIFGILRSVIRLSEKYDRDYFERLYAFDPTNGHELDVEIELNSSILVDAENETDYYGVETGGFLAAIDPVMQRARAIANENELTRIAVSAMQQYFDELGKACDEPMTDDEYRAMWDHIGQSVLPFLNHLNRPMKLPVHVLEQLSQNS